MISNGRLFDYVPMKLLLMMIIFPHLFPLWRKKATGRLNNKYWVCQWPHHYISWLRHYYPLIFHGRCLYPKKASKTGDMSSAV
jgi:hypothetical protein